ncbi:sesquipedalian [Anaeramoeba flamelloides]|uniref:Sesquipedalian n=1 Tax=Anaeramoeba flamelloides TaxID=1746091 RepID=A0AAV8A0D7_9EUKA|nr:sesquipedalian [Anaeramoeba flamelloides]
MQNPREFQGELVKRGGRVHSWKDRFFFLSNKTLSYYKKGQFEKNSKAKGAIDLTYGTSCGIGIFEENKDKPTCFYIRRPNRTYLISSNSEEDRSNWMNRITEHTRFPRSKSVEFIGQIPSVNVTLGKPISQEEEEEILSSIIITSIPNQISQEKLQKYIESSKIFQNQPDCKKTFLSRRNCYWIAINCPTIKQSISFQDWVKKNPLKIKNQNISTPIIIPRCKYEDIKKLQTEEKQISNKHIDVYLLYHRKGVIIRMTVKKRKQLNEQFLLKLAEIDHVRLFDINEKYQGTSTNERIFTVIEYGNFPQDLKLFTMNLNLLQLGKIVPLYLQSPIGLKNERDYPQFRQSISSKQKNLGSRFNIESELKKKSENNLSIKNIIINAIFKLQDLTTKEEDFYLLVGNDFLKHDDLLPLQNNYCDGFLIKKRKLSTSNEEKSTDDEDGNEDTTYDEVDDLVIINVNKNEEKKIKEGGEDEKGKEGERGKERAKERKKKKKKKKNGENEKDEKEKEKENENEEEDDDEKEKEKEKEN